MCFTCAKGDDVVERYPSEPEATNQLPVISLTFLSAPVREIRSVAPWSGPAGHDVGRQAEVAATPLASVLLTTGRKSAILVA